MKKVISIALCILMVFMLWPSAVFAASTITWTGSAGDGSWHNTGNWDPAQVPGTGDTAVIPESKTAVITADTSVTLDCFGEMEVASGGHLSLTGISYLRSGRLYGDGDITITGSTSDALQWTKGVIEGNGAFTVESGKQLVIGGNDQKALARPTINNGSIILNAGEFYLTGGMEGTGSISVGAGSYLSFEEGDYSIGGDFTNNGKVTIWDDVSSISFNADYKQGSTGSLALKVWGNESGEYCRLVVGDEAELGGVLEIDFINGYDPQPDDTFEIMSYRSRTGTFSSIVSNLPEITFEPTYTDTGLTLTVVAASGNVCKIGSTEYATLDDALAAVQSGETIKLLQTIYYPKNSSSSAAIENDGNNITFDLSGYTLDIHNSEGLGINLKNNGEILFTGGGELIIRSKASGLTVDNSKFKADETVTVAIESSNAAGVEANESTVEILDGSVSGNTNGIYADSDCTITVRGPVTSVNSHAVLLDKPGNTVYVDSAVVMGSSAVDVINGVYINEGGSVTVGTPASPGIVKSGIGKGISTIGSSSYRAYVTVYGDVESSNHEGITASNNSEIKVYGNVTSTSSHPDHWGILSSSYYYDSNLVEIHGDVSGINGISVSGRSSSIKVFGNITATGTNNNHNRGVYASNATAEITGDIIATKCIGAWADPGGQITVNGVITANRYIRVGSIVKEIDDKTLPTTKNGYHTYNNVTATVWVKDTAVPAVPSAPRNFTATPGDSQVTLSWTAPASDGGSSITKYQVSKDNGFTWTDVGLNTSYTFTGLTNDIEYTFKVRAFNGAGTGAEASVTATPTAPAHTIYTVNFYSDGILYASETVTGGSSLGAKWPGNPTRSGYSFGGWFTGHYGSGTQYTSDTVITSNVDLYAKWTYNAGSGAGGGGGSSTPSTPIYKADVRKENSTDTTLPVKVNEDDGTASIDVGSQNFTQGETIVIIPAVPGVGTYSTGIPVPCLSTADVQGTLTLNTNLGSITVPSNMLTGVAGADGNTARIVIGQGNKSTLPKDLRSAVGNRPLIQLTLSIDGKQIAWHNPKTSVTVAIPYTPTPEELARPEHITVWYIDDNGRIDSLDGKYDPLSGTVIFTTSHFNCFAVVYDPVTRLAGMDRVETGLRIARAAYPDKINHAVLATAYNYPDALAGSVLAYKLDAPLLLVGSSEKDQAMVISYLEDNLKPEGTVYILGGTGVISQSFANQVRASTGSKIYRINGKNRYETSVQIAEQLEVKTGTPVILVSGENYPDTLAVSSIAAQQQLPILLAQKDGLSAAVSQELAQIKPDKIYIIGLEGAISSNVVDQAAKITGLTAENIIRIGGADRFATSLAVAEYFNLGSETLCLATGKDYPDSLVGSVYAAKHKAPVILTDGTIPAQTADYLKSKKPTEAVIFGGEAVISKTVKQQIRQLLDL